MSDSDDTDLLLLIPPDFFLVNPDQDDFVSKIEPRDVEREVVSDLITQVNDLESRICAIEYSEGSRSRTSAEELKNDSAKKNLNQSCVEEDFYNLTDATSQFSELGINSRVSNYSELYKRGSCDLSNLLNSPRKELDSSMASGSRLRDPISVSPEKGKTLWSPSKRLDLPEVDRLLNEMETTQAEIESKLREREVEYGLNTDKLNQLESRRKISQLGEDIGSIPDLGFGIRSMFAKPRSASPTKNPKDKPRSKSPVVEEPCTKKNVPQLGSGRNETEDWRSYLSHDYGSAGRAAVNPTYTSSPERSRSKPPRRRLHLSSDGSFIDKSLKSTIEHDLFFGEDKKLPLVQSTQSVGLEIHRDKGETGGVNTRSDILNPPKHSSQTEKLPSRRNEHKSYPLGGSGDKLLSLNDLWQGDDGVGNNPLRLRQKLEEEKYRRMHLEQAIQNLQKKVLEEQEKLAVAIKVDEAKDKAIGQITQAWRQMVEHWKKLEEQRHQASQTLITERALFKRGQEETDKKVERWEKEVSQALDLAAGYKRKCERLEVDLSSTKESLERKSNELEEKLRAAEDKLRQLEEERKVLASRLQISEEEHDQERQLVVDARNDLGRTEENLSKSCAELAVVKEQRDLLSTRLKEERGRNSTLEQQKKALQEALSDSKQAQTKAEEKLKVTMGGLDRAKSELRGMYQAQLESVVREKLEEFQGQLDRAQSAMQAQLQDSQRQAQEKTVQQQQALVNSHVIEMRRLESMHKEEVRTLENKLLEVQRRCTRLEGGKKDIAQKLHSVMESQWQQALSIITSELSIRQSEPEQGRKDYFEDKDRRLELNLAGVGSASCGSSMGQSEETPFNKDGQLTYRVSNPPPSQNLTNLPPAKQDQLMKYIQMLLDKQPGHPVDSLTSSGILHDVTVSDLGLDETTGEQPKWNEIMTSKDNEPNERTGPNSRMKPPWK